MIEYWFTIIIQLQRYQNLCDEGFHFFECFVCDYEHFIHTYYDF